MAPPIPLTTIQKQNELLISQSQSQSQSLLQLKPDLYVNKNNLLWIQKIGECIYFSQSDKIHEVCNSSKKEDSLFHKLDSEFFSQKK